MKSSLENAHDPSFDVLSLNDHMVSNKPRTLGKEDWMDERRNPELLALATLAQAATLV